MYPPVAGVVKEACKEGIQFGEYFIPGGSLIVVSVIYWNFALVVLIDLHRSTVMYLKFIFSARSVICTIIILLCSLLIIAHSGICIYS